MTSCQNNLASNESIYLKVLISKLAYLSLYQGSTVAEHSTRNPTTEGSNLATVTEREREMTEKNVLECELLLIVLRLVKMLGMFKLFL